MMGSQMTKALAIATFLWLAGCVVHRETRTTTTSSTTSNSSTSTTTATPAPAPSWAEPPPSGPPRSNEEVCLARQAIVEALRASAEPWAAGLADRTEAATCELDADGTARIGGWSLPPCEADCDSPAAMRFLFREEGAQVPSYAAQLDRDQNGFRCTDLGQFHVIPQQ